MSNGAKTVLYALLSVCTLVFGVLSYRNIRQSIAFKNAKLSSLMDQAGDTGAATSPPEAPSDAVTTNSPVTNIVVPSNNSGLTAINQVLDATNVQSALTNFAAVMTNQRPANAELTNILSDTNTLAQAASPNLKSKEKSLSGTKINAQSAPPRHMGVYIGLLILSALGLGTLAAFDISQFTGDRALKAIYNDDLEGIKEPEYDDAEAEWANGNHLEAVRMMREYLLKNPKEQHVSLRIAEIYEKDLNNFLAAALEYEEVLKHKLAPERWGWAAIHLCNLYFKLDHEDKAVALLKKIDSEYGQTAAADKARKRLEQMNIPTSLDEAAAQADARAEAAPAPVEEKGPKLPPGFSMKKR